LKEKLFYVSDLRNAFFLGKNNAFDREFNEWVKELKIKRIKQK
jgi:hypothetical protein